MNMQNKYWVQYRYENHSSHCSEDFWYTVSCFVTTGLGTDHIDLEHWWQEEVVYGCQHELLQVVKL